MPSWLKCKIALGMFSDEYTVTVHTRSGENVAVFVSKYYAQEENSRVKVRVSEDSGRAIAVLPDANQSVIDVE